MRTPSPMACASAELLGHPTTERPFVFFPIGFSLNGAQAPDLHRKLLDDVRTIDRELPTSNAARDPATERR